MFYGSSSFRMWETLAEDFPGVPVVNAAFGGSTLAACAWFFGRLVVPLRPRSLLLYAGDNDLGDGRAPADVVASFRDLADQKDIALPGVPFGFVSIKPSPSRQHLTNAIRETNTAIHAELARYPEAFYIDIFDGMLGRDGAPCPEFYAEDGLHLSSAGYRVWKEVIGGYRDRWL